MELLIILSYIQRCILWIKAHKSVWWAVPAPVLYEPLSYVSLLSELSCAVMSDSLTHSSKLYCKRWLQTEQVPIRTINNPVALTADSILCVISVRALAYPISAFCISVTTFIIPVYVTIPIQRNCKCETHSQSYSNQQ
jgi:hypothetical protein